MSNKQETEQGKATAEQQEKVAAEQQAKAETEKQDQAQESAPAEETAKEEPAQEDWKSKYEQLNDSYLRTRAEFDNYRKRTLAEKAELIKNGGEKVLSSILGVVDDFERGLDAMEKAEDIAAVKEGMTLVYNKLQKFLEQNGVSVIETKDQTFDTDLHEAITMISVADASMKGKVMECVQKGYYLNGKVIRFAKVVVAQ